MKAKSAKLKIYPIHDTLYEMDTLLLCGPYAQVSPLLDRILGPGAGDCFVVGNEPAGRTAFIENGDFGSGLVLWLGAFDPQNAGHIGLLAHEAYHATCMVLGHRGVRHDATFDPGGAEAFAYYHGWLVREAFTHLSKPHKP